MEADARRANRLKHAAALWSRYIDSSSARQLDRWLSETLRAEKRFGSQDRRFYSDVLFASARWVTLGLFLEHVHCGVRQFCGHGAESQKEMLRSFCAANSSEEQLWSSVRSLPSMKLIELTQALSDEKNPLRLEIDSAISSLAAKTDWRDEDYSFLLVLHGIPPEWSQPLQRRRSVSGWSQSDVIQFLQAQNERPPLWIRLNQPSAREQLEKEFVQHGLLVKWSEDNENCAAVSGNFGVYQTVSFQQGLFEVQDWASQQIAEAVGARAGQKIWDACAGGGGKSVAIAAALQGKGALYASDIREHKLSEAKRRCQRAGFHNIRTLVWDGVTAPQFGREVFLQAGFDSVLVDAPCSSSGTWRRNPDARLRIASRESRESLYALQRQLLANAARQVRRGGRLVYGTCSWCVEENEDVFTSVLKTLQAVSPTESTMKLVGAPFVNSDTMFAAATRFLDE
ncbi:MAG: hypothetical protein RLZZ488_823 [Pseudomonadota bacterium]|jgi:16S rRNA (cytosine967-C5)-methyltransferase